MNSDNLKILIITGIYPPRIGGSAQYAKEVRDGFFRLGCLAKVLTFNAERYLPTGFRHFWFFIKVILNLRGVDFILALDTFSVGFPGVIAALIFGKKTVIRIGGDFLWEQYVERTKEPILLNEFYDKDRPFSLKEKLIFKLTKWTLSNASTIVFSTSWQRDIWQKPYDLDLGKTKIVENYYGPVSHRSETQGKLVFVSSSRDLFLKNKPALREVFASLQKGGLDISLDESTSSHEELQKKIQNYYAVIVPSLSEVSSNLALEAIRFGKPVLITDSNGLKDRISGVALFFDPRNISDIADKIRFVCDGGNYGLLQKKLAEFNFTHSWDEIAQEFLAL